MEYFLKVFPPFVRLVFNLSCSPPYPPPFLYFKILDSWYCYSCIQRFHFFLPLFSSKILICVFISGYCYEGWSHKVFSTRRKWYSEEKSTRANMPRGNSRVQEKEIMLTKGSAIATTSRMHENLTRMKMVSASPARTSGITNPPREFAIPSPHWRARHVKSGTKLRGICSKSLLPCQI